MTPGAQAVFAKGAAALEAQDLPAAEALFGEIVAADPGAHEAWNALAVVAVRAGAAELGAMRARQALALSRRNPLYLNNLGVACGELLAYEEAESHFRRALKLKPVYPEALFNLGKVLHKQRRLEEAARAFERAYAMNPEFPGLRPAFAALLRVLGCADRAMAVLAPGAGMVPEAFAPQYTECIAEVRGVQSALQWLEDALVRYPGSRNLRFLHATVLLSVGEWRRGWKEYFWRPSRPTGGAPELLPVEIAGKRVLLRAEQGLGDVLFFLRFADELRARGATVALHGPASLFPLLGRENIQLVDQADSFDATQSDHVLWISDLPAALDASGTPQPVPLHCADGLRDAAARRLASFGPPPYLGLTWRAGTDVLRRREYGNDQYLLAKEVDPERLGQALRGWPGTVVALQRNPEAAELAAVARGIGAAVHDLSTLNEDLSLMLGVLDAVDEYVAVSNTNVHLLAGIGRTARVLVPQPPEWRWMHEGESPWFPGFSVYRQPPSRDWSEPLARLRREVLP